MGSPSIPERLDPLLRLPVSALRSLASSLGDGLLSEAITQRGVEQAAGTDAGAVTALLRELTAEGFTPRHLALLVGGLAAAIDRAPKPTNLFDLVLSGPDLPGVPTSDTAAVMHTMITSATHEILLVGYAVHNGKRLFEPLAGRMEQVPSLAVTFCLDIPRAYNDPTPAKDLVARFAREFRERHWPWSRLPRLFFDPRSLLVGDKRASLHAKCVVVDRSRALVTSANFTEAAQRRNIEAGVDLRHQPTAQRISDYFQGLCSAGLLEECLLAP
ncbi:MAG: DISARM system phospholipase D-like protein DrmC [Planctomycetaceae bacterium]